MLQAELKAVIVLRCVGTQLKTNLSLLMQDSTTESGGCTTRRFSDGALRSEARAPPGPSLGGGAEPTVSDTVGGREGTWWWKQKEKDVKPFFPCFLGFYVQV